MLKNSFELVETPNNLLVADFLISISFSYDLPVFVSTSNIPANSNFFHVLREIKTKWFRT